MIIKKLLLISAQIGIMTGQKIAARLSARKPKSIIDFGRFDPMRDAFIAVYASYLKFPDDSAENLLAFLKKRGAFVVFVTNHSTPQPDRVSRDLVDVFIDNGGYGRDIGQFKAATLYLKDRFRGRIPEKVMYCNDSVFYVDRGDGSFIDEMLDVNYDFVGTFENPGRESLRAPWFISSWFFSVSRGLFESNGFIEFFENYKSINNKSHAVRGGEILLTKVALAYSGRLKAIYSNRYLLDLLLRYSKEHGSEAAASILPLQIRDEYESRFRKPASTDHFIRYVERNLYRFSPTHMFLLLLLKETKFPFIKKDLFWSGGVAYDQLSDFDNILANFCSPIETQQLRSYFRLRGKPTDASILVRASIALGIK